MLIKNESCVKQTLSSDMCCLCTIKTNKGFVKNLSQTVYDTLTKNSGAENQEMGSVTGARCIDTYFNSKGMCNIFFESDISNGLCKNKPQIKSRYVILGHFL